MADIDINYDLFDGNLKYAIVCSNKFELEHCLKAHHNSFPSVFFTSPKRFSRFVLNYGLPAAVSPNLHKHGYGIGYDHQSYYEDENYIVVDFKDVAISQFQESDIAIEEFLGIRLAK